MMCAMSLEASTAFAAGLKVSENGVGGIGRATAFDKKAIEKAVPGLLVRPGKRSTEGQSYPVFTVVDGKEVLATVFPGDTGKGILSVRVTSRKVINTLGPVLGATYASIFARVARPGCAAGEEEMSGKVICPHPKSKHVAYVLAGKSDGPDGALPSPKALARFAVKEIVWRQ
jgi:hypothetical protein